MKYIKKILFAFFVVMFIILPAIDISAQDALGGLKNTAEEGGYKVGDDDAPEQEVAQALLRYSSGLVVLMGALYMILMIYVGYLWMSSRGNEEQIAKAKTIAIWATAGIATIIMARIIAEFVIITLGAASGTPKTPTTTP